MAIIASQISEATAKAMAAMAKTPRPAKTVRAAPARQPATSTAAPPAPRQPRGPAHGTPDWEELLERLLLGYFGDMPARDAPWWLLYQTLPGDDDPEFGELVFECQTTDGYPRWMPDAAANEFGFGVLTTRRQRWLPDIHDLPRDNEHMCVLQEIDLQAEGFHIDRYWD